MTIPQGYQIDPGPTSSGAVTTYAGASRYSSARHLVWPLQLNPDGSFASLEQDSEEEVAQSVQVLLTTRVGERYRDAPDYGLDEPITGDPVNTSLALAAIDTFEPRAAVSFAVTPISADGGQSVTVNVGLTIGGPDVTPNLDRPT